MPLLYAPGNSLGLSPLSLYGLNEAKQLFPVLTGQLPVYPVAVLPNARDRPSQQTLTPMLDSGDILLLCLF